MLASFLPLSTLLVGPDLPGLVSHLVPLQVFPGFGTAVNVVTVLVGTGVGLLVGNRLSDRTRSTITDVLGLVTLVVGGFSVIDLDSESLRAVVGGGGVIVVLLALLVGGLAGSALDLEGRIDQLGEWARRRLLPAPATGAPLSDDGTEGVDSDVSSVSGHRFVEGFVTATLLFCVGPLAILGSIDDGLGLGADKLLVKAVLDGFAAMAFASALGVGVGLAAASVLVYQGLWTLLGWLLGSILPTAEVNALSATGGVILVGLGIRLLELKPIRVADLVPALAVAPLLVALVQAVR